MVGLLTYMLKDLGSILITVKNTHDFSSQSLNVKKKYIGIIVIK
jgi:hypothetical protein